MDRIPFGTQKPRHKFPHPLHKLTGEYLACAKPEARARAAERIREFGGPIGHGLASYAFVDTLARAPQLEKAEKIRLYDAAAMSAKHAVNRSDIHDETASAKIKASALLAELPLLKSMYIDGRAPSLEAVADSYKASAAVLSDARDFIRSSNTATRNGHTGSNVVGAMAEIGVKMLLNRYALRSIREAGYVAVSSLFGDDNAKSKKQGIVPWDISLFATPFEDTYTTPTYKIQVKTANTKQNRIGDVVFVSPRDLATPRHDCNYGMLAAYVIGEAQWQSSESTQALDAWTDVLLDRLDGTETTA